MKIKDYGFDERNNALIVFGVNDNIELYLDIPTFIKFLEEDGDKFYHIADEKDRPVIVINKDRINCVIFKEEK